MRRDNRPGVVIDMPHDATVDSGDFVIEDGLIGFANGDSAVGQGFALVRKQEFPRAPKVAGTAWAVGDRLFFNGTAFKVASATEQVHAIATAVALSAATVGSLIVLETPTVDPARIANLEAGSGEIGYLVENIGHADFDADATSQTLAFDALSATLNAYLIAVWLEKITDFSGGTVSAATLEVGHDVPTADPNAYVLAEDVFTGAGAGNVGFVTAEKGVDQIPATLQPILPATNKITATMRTTGDDVADLAAGAAKVHALYRLLG